MGVFRFKPEESEPAGAETEVPSLGWVFDTWLEKLKGNNESVLARLPAPLPCECTRPVCQILTGSAHPWKFCLAVEA